MNAQEINIILAYWEKQGDKKMIAYYKQKAEQYQIDQYKD